MPPTPTIKKNLAFLSGNLCAMPDCQQALLEFSKSGVSTAIGEAAHIAGEHGGTATRQASARYDSSMSPSERNAIGNLIYLCPICHKRIDAIPQGEIDFPTAHLLELKHAHEAKVAAIMASSFADVAFTELEKATNWVVQKGFTSPESDFEIVEIREKMEKNKLSASSQSLVKMGLSSSGEVANFVELVAHTDVQFPARLIAGFKSIYNQLVQEGYHGDELFIQMLEKSRQGFSQPSLQFAGLCVMIHLFELCEIFER